MVEKINSYRVLTVMKFDDNEICCRYIDQKKNLFYSVLTEYYSSFIY